MSSELVLTNAIIIGRDDSFRGTVCLRDGCIHSVERGPSAALSALDLEGDYLTPGLIDVHTDNLERHLAPRLNARWPAVAALIAHDAQVSGVGITTVLDAVCVGMDRDFEGRSRDFVCESVAALRAAASGGWLRAEHFLHLRCDLPSPHTVSEFAQVYKTPALRLVSLIDHTPGHRQIRDLRRARNSVERRSSMEMTDEEWEQRVQEAKSKQEKYAPANRTQLLALARARRVAVASHDDTTVADIEEAVASGIAIAEFPTTLEAASAARERGMKTVMGAPNVVLGSSQSGNASAREAARAGLVDCLSSDYAPVSLLHAAFLLASEIGMPLPEAFAMVTANPAQIIGLNDRGAISPGLRADLVQVRLGDGIPRAIRVWRQGERIN